MRKYLAWVLFWLGDMVSRPMERFDWGWLYRPYSALMVWSAAAQGTGDGPWQAAEDDKTLGVGQ